MNTLTLLHRGIRAGAFVLVVGLGLASTVGCARTPAPLVQELLESGAAPLPLELASVEGGRDGARTRAEFLFGGGGAELRLELVVEYDPQPVLHQGRWSYRGPTGTDAGDVSAESVRFVGGQGEGVSVGGVYLLRSSGHARFRVDLPLTAIAERWSAERR